MAGSSLDFLKEESKQLLFARVAEKLLSTGKNDEAIKVCEEGLRANPAYAQGHYVLAKCYLKSERNDEARHELERVLKFNNKHLNALKDLTEIYQAQGLEDLRDEFIARIATLDPLNAEFSAKAENLKIYQRLSVTEPEEEIKSEEIDLASEAEPTDIWAEETDEQEEPEIIIDLGAGDEDEEEEPESDSSFDPELVEIEREDRHDEFNSILEGIFSETKSDESDPFAVAEETEQITRELLSDDYLKPPDEDTEEIDDSQPEEDELGAATEKLIDETFESDETEFETVTEEGQIEVPADEDADIFGPEIKEEQAIEALKDQISEIPPEKIKVDETTAENKEPVFNQRMVSKTLGEILFAQKKYSEAKGVFEKLIEQQGASDYLKNKVEIIDKIIAMQK